MSILTATANFENTQFKNNYAVNGGVINGEGLAKINEFNNVTSSHNYALSNGGVIYLSGKSYLVATDSMFSNNTASDQGSVLYFLGTSKSTMSDWSFISNTANNGNTMMLLFADTNLNNITVKDNQANIESTGIFINFSEVEIASSTFTTEKFMNGATTLIEASKKSRNTGLFISISAGCNVSIKDSSFKNGYADTGGYIYMVGTSDLTITGSTFEGSSVTGDGGAIYASRHQTLSIESCTFISNSAQRDGSVLYLDSGTTSVSSSNFTVTPITSAIYTSLNSFTGEHLIFQNENVSNTEYKQDVFGGGIQVLNAKYFEIISSTFNSLNFAEKGGAIYVMALASAKDSNIPTDPVYKIFNCTFTSNSAMNGGAIYVDNVDYAQINSSTFTNNKAVTYKSAGGDGGGLYYASSGKLSQYLTPHDMTGVDFVNPVYR